MVGVANSGVRLGGSGLSEGRVDMANVIEWQRAPSQRCRGVVLVAVLWVMALLVLLATGIAAQTRTDHRLTRNLLAAEQAYYAAEGGVFYAVNQLQGPPGPGPQQWGVPAVTLRLGNAVVRTEVVDERGKIDLNQAPPELIRGVLLATGIEFEESERLADAILDWRDTDDLRRLHGAEDGDYRVEGYDYGAKDAPFDSVEELNRVLGMRAEVYALLREAFTVHTGAPDVNPLMAPPLVLAAIPGTNDELVRAYVEARENSRAEDQPPPVFPLESNPYVTRDHGPAYSVTAQASVAERAEKKITAVVVLQPQAAQRGYRVISWNSTTI